MELNIRDIKKHAGNAAKLLKSLSHPARLLIVCQLIEGEKNVAALWQLSSLSQSAFSQHLSILRRDKLVQTRKTSQTVFYSLANGNVEKIVNLLHQLYCHNK